MPISIIIRDELNQGVLLAFSILLFIGRIFVVLSRKISSSPREKMLTLPQQNPSKKRDRHVNGSFCLHRKKRT